MKTSCSWLPEAVAIAGTAVGVGVAIRGWPTFPDAEGQTWAAWAQALGTVVAIAGAFFVGMHQAKMTLLATEVSTKMALRGKRNSVIAVVDAACKRVDDLCLVIRPTDEGRAKLWMVYHPSIFESMVNALSSAPVYELESAPAVEALLRFRDQYVFFSDSVGRFSKGPHEDAYFMSAIPQYDLTKATDRKAVDELRRQWLDIAVGNIHIHTDALHKYRDSLVQALKSETVPSSNSAV